MEDAQGPRQFGTWPTPRRSAFTKWSLVGFGGVFTLAAWVAVLTGHPRAILWAVGVPVLLVCVVKFMPAYAARFDGDELTLPSGVRPARSYSVRDITAVRPAGLLAPVVVVEAPGVPSGRLWIGASAEPFLAELRAAVVPSADKLPDGAAWLPVRRKVWIVFGWLFAAPDAV